MSWNHDENGLRLFREQLKDAQARIGHVPKPFPRLEGFPSNAYCAKWGLTDLYPEDEFILRTAITERKSFDTGWVGCKKEIRSFRIITNGEFMVIYTSAEMDDIEDLIYDATPDGVELTEAQFNEVLDYWYEDTEMETEVGSEITIPVTTYEDAMKVIAYMEHENDDTLKEWFEIVTTWVKEVINNVTFEEKEDE